ncbi:MAG TPA: hypothetical protein VFA04_12750 [Bryobacteraceae bacterium]|nr:hypothetical protein [Bryobacteraceae bacterium]
MVWRIAIIAAAAFLLNAQDTSKPDLNGTWRSDNGVTLSIAGSPDSLHVTETRGGETTDWTCGTEGKNCDLPGAHKGTVSAWYNGPALVIMETRGSDVVKKRIELSADKSKLEMEIFPIVPEGKTEKIELTKKS